MKYLLVLLTTIAACTTFAQNNLRGGWGGNGGGNLGRNPYDRVQRVDLVCESNDYRSHSCNVGGQIVNGYMNHQISRSACIENSTYFIQGNNIVVTSGCRAQFSVDIVVGGAPNYPPQPGGYTQYVQCDSNTRNFNPCYVGASVQSVQLVRQDSRSACILNSSYGISNDSIWVDKGCRGLFKVRTW